MSESELEQKPYLYILMRTDLDSMNPGKMAAQACHAANAFVHGIMQENEYIRELYKVWRDSTTQGFGVTITLDGSSMGNINDFYDSLDNDEVSAGIVHDPTYPITDGDVTHLVHLDTCMYVFYDKNVYNLLDTTPLLS